jgi:mannose-6-phosphate isomerase-like protein (cupin superfamily)
MPTKTIRKINANNAPMDDHGQVYLASGLALSLRLWQEGPREHDKVATRREYETAGYVISGRAELEMAGQVVGLEAGDSWIVPAGMEHRYRVIEDFVAVEATSPPARTIARDL